MDQLFSPVGLWTIASVLLVSAASLVGIVLLSLSERVLNKLLLPLVSFATGAMLGNVFVHLFPEVIGEAEHIEKALLFVLGGMLLSFAIEKAIHWHHCHHLGCDHHYRPAGKMILLGDGIHNFLDGMLIAAAFMADIRLGVATTIAVILHEIPQEIGDFSILIHSGFTVARALFLNFLSALSSVAGALAVLLLATPVSGIESILLPIAAGNFLYIAGSDLIPELHKESRPKQAALQFICILLGVGLMLVLSGAANPHG
ncbi:MAG: ZIP family metal transporter [Candidatus Peribacteraceae bacterium]|nr:ZIP family metal transporter [Candidatus Peribacteraceae bacterium]